MWEKILSFFASVFNIGTLLVENQQSLKDLQKQTDETETALKLLAQKFDHFTEMERLHHQKNLLELENRILQMERRLPPANDKEAE